MSHYFLEERVRELVSENTLLKKQIEVMETVIKELRDQVIKLESGD